MAIHVILSFFRFITMRRFQTEPIEVPSYHKKENPHKYLTYKGFCWVEDRTRTGDIQNHNLTL